MCWCVDGDGIYGEGIGDYGTGGTWKKRDCCGELTCHFG